MALSLAARAFGPADGHGTRACASTSSVANAAVTSRSGIRARMRQEGSARRRTRITAAPGWGLSVACRPVTPIQVSPMTLHQSFLDELLDEAREIRLRGVGLDVEGVDEGRLHLRRALAHGEPRSGQRRGLVQRVHAARALVEQETSLGSEPEAHRSDEAHRGRRVHHWAAFLSAW